jgi:hypothetical protein
VIRPLTEPEYPAHCLSASLHTNAVIDSKNLTNLLGFSLATGASCRQSTDRHDLLDWVVSHVTLPSGGEGITRSVIGKGSKFSPSNKTGL